MSHDVFHARIPPRADSIWYEDEEQFELVVNYPTVFCCDAVLQTVQVRRPTGPSISEAIADGIDDKSAPGPN